MMHVKSSLFPAAVPAVARTLGLGLTALAAACSPAFNWRDAPIDAQLTALLPCKPDRAERQLPLTPEGAQATIAMAGCQAGGATFAVAHWSGLEVAQAAAHLQAWQAATRNQWTGAALQESPVAMPGARATPAAAQWQLQRGDAPAGDHVQIRWFARADAQGRITLYQASVLGRPSAPEAAATFFEGLRLR